ncbi:MAG: lipid-binding SYLF domain-containing protein [Rhodospirillales bacterium]|nr:lipid-binding SYLF domain-containing protein [Rhodospirillales bacterium]
MTRFAFSLLLLLVAFVAPLKPAQANEGAAIVARAVATIERLRSDTNFILNVDPHLKKAKAVLIVPELLKGGFIIGAEYGNGALLLRGPDGAFGQPAFYTVGGGSIGLQIGAQSAEMLFLLMNDKAIKAVMENRFRAGAGLSVAVGLLGASGGASTTTALGADIYAFGHAVGLFGGGAFEGTTIQPRPAFNAQYYGGQPSPEDILTKGMVANPQSEMLRRALGPTR